MEDLAELLEQQLERAFEVKDKKSLRQYVNLLIRNLVPRDSYERQLVELKEEIRLIAETMKLGFESMDKRFEDLQRFMDKRFGDLQISMDKRFEFVDKRFEATDKRFEDMNKRFETIDKRFEDMNKRFEAIDKRFEDMYRYMDKRFEDMNKRFSAMFTFMNFGFGIIILMTILFKFFVK